MSDSFPAQLCAHRGWTETAQENSFEAIREAVDRGCPAVEFDVQCTADDVWVVNHDPDLERLHEAEGKIAELTWSELSARVSLPRLDEVLALFRPGVLPLVEIKEPAARGVDSLVRSLRDARRRAPLAAIARGEAMPRALSAAIPDLDLYLFHLDWEQALATTIEGITGYDLPHDDIAGARIPRRVAEVHSQRRRLAVFTINDPSRAAAWLDARADWVITDVPWILRDLAEPNPRDDSP